MIVLYILIGIVVLFALILSIRAHIHVEYEKELTAYAKWAFIKIPLLPAPEKKPKPKKEKPPEEEETPKEETQKKKGPSPIAILYENEQLKGILEILGKLINIIDKFGRRFANSFVIDEMFLDIEVTKGDSAQTAEEYGKMCRRVFPVTGAVCANCNVKKYSINVEPDFIANPGTRVAFSMEISLNPRKLINAVLIFAFDAIFKVGIRVIKSMQPKKTDAVPESAETQQLTEKINDNDTNTIESGAQ